jgi:hypothetical protein
MGKSQNGSSRARYVQKRKRRTDQVRSRGSYAGSPQQNDDTWQPATSAPGEIYTPAGRVRASGALLSGLVTRDPRRRALQREGLRPLLFMLPLVALVGVVVSLLMRLF